MRVTSVAARSVSLEAFHLEDVRLAARKFMVTTRRAFQAEMALKYCGSGAWGTEDVFGWSRHAVQPGLHEKCKGTICLGLHAFCCGAKRWEKRTPGGGASAVGTGGKSCATGSDVSHDVVVHPPDGRGSHQAVASAGICRGHTAFAKRHVGSVEPQRVPIASGAQGQTPSRVRRSHRQVHPPAELSALRQQVQPGGTLLGNPGKALERRQADRRPSDAPGGQEHDLDRRSSRRQTEAHRLRKRNHRHQGRHASGRPGCKQTRSCPSAAS